MATTIVTGAIKTARDCGTLHMISDANRSTSADVNDGTVNDTWDVADFSGVVPNGTRALLLFAVIRNSDVQERALLQTRDTGSSSGADRSTMTMWIEAARSGTTGLSVVGAPIIIYATNGVFEYRRASAIYTIDSLEFTLVGYYL